MALKIFINKGNLLINSVEPADGMIIGRSPDSALHLDDTMISRQHAVIHEINGQFVLEDLNSANGLIVEGRMEKKIILEAGLNIEVPPYTQNVTGNDDVESPRSLDELMREEIPAEAFQEEISAGTKKTSNEVTDVEVIAEAKIETPKIVGARTIIIPFEAKPRFYPLNMAMSQEFLGLMEDIAIIGRTADSDIVLSHASVSSRHALLTRQGEHYFIEDQQSTNGVRLNGELVKESLLKCHDILEFGEVQLEYIEGPALPQGRSHNVVEIVENPEFEGITLKPNLGMQQLSAKFLPKVRQISIALGCALLLLIVAPMLRRPQPIASILILILRGHLRQALFRAPFLPQQRALEHLLGILY
jgi:pSer/pThr/pTyr-binding forkhead associated (FHA) protein